MNTHTKPQPQRPWSPESWQQLPAAQQVTYPDPNAIRRATKKLADFPPLVTSGEIERLTSLIAAAQRGERFLLQGGDCAEMLDDCRPDTITNKLKILLQMSLVLVHGLKKPVVRVGRLAGQYAKPRSSATETIADQTLPSYFGDLINNADFNPASRMPDPDRLVQAYLHSAVTLNFLRSLIDGGFADLHNPQHWDMSFLEHADLRPDLKNQYHRMTRQLAEALSFMEALGDKKLDDLTRIEFFTSHEGLNLIYEAAQTRTVPRKSGWWDLTTHLPWIGERTRQLDGAHIEFFRGIRNPVGVKLGPSATAHDAIDLANALNPDNQPGKLVFITRFGADKVEKHLPQLIEGFAQSRKHALWIADPMHGNTRTVTTARDAKVKTRRFDDILSELEATIDCHERAGTVMGGVHFELTGDDVTECVGGGSGVTEHDLATNYTSRCDPRLNYQQALELAFLLARRLGTG